MPRRLWLLAVVLVCTMTASSQVRLTLGASANANSSGTIPIILTGGAEPAALQWTLVYSSTAIEPVTITETAESTGAGKSVFCRNSLHRVTCVLFGINQTRIPDGPVARITFTPAQSGSRPPFVLSDIVAAAGDGTGMPVSHNAQSKLGRRR